MKKISLSTMFLALSAAVFAHAGHNHSEMNSNEFSLHLLWIAVPVVIGVATFFVMRKRKNAEQ
ncbi:hypothetical protein [Saccharicrinis aurantiacus]|uniref:hypothetical protein n=1 Tax=Saccharicrinis aurantiacus TaxID=1849719 RepID=UPI00095030DE|nr:hypothetical protein [Saccharicrinis aurantiacus]